MTGNDEGMRYVDYLKVFPDARKALEYAEQGYTHFALGEMDSVRRETFALHGNGIEGFISETEKIICKRGMEISLNLAREESKAGNKDVAEYHKRQAKEFASRIGMNIENAVNAALAPLRK